MWTTASQKTWLSLLILLIFVTIISYEYWRYWFVPTIFVFFGWLADCMFLEQGMFYYEPSLDYWKEANDPDY